MKRYYIELEGLTTEQAGKACDKLVELGAGLSEGVAGVHSDPECPRGCHSHKSFAYLGVNERCRTYLSDAEGLFLGAELITYDELMALGSQNEEKDDVIHNKAQSRAGIYEFVRKGDVESLSISGAIAYEKMGDEVAFNFGSIDGMGDAIDMIHMVKALSKAAKELAND